MLPASTQSLLNGPVMNGESSFVLSPMEDGLRLTSQVEFGGLSAAPDYARVRSLLPVAKRMLPGIDAREESVWMGFRPSLPDSLPVLGFSMQQHRSALCIRASASWYDSGRYIGFRRCRSRRR